MPKRKACDVLPGLPTSPLSKKPRVHKAESPPSSRPSSRESHTSPPRAARHKMAKRSAADAFGSDAATDLESKRVRMRPSPSDSISRSPSPSPWPTVNQYNPHEDPIDTIHRERIIRYRRAFDQTKARDREARRQYAMFRQSRLPSPVSSDSGIDSEADENGYVPLNFNLEDDASEVAAVFGADYACLLRNRMRKCQVTQHSTSRNKTMQLSPTSPTRTTQGGRAGALDGSRAVKTGRMSRRKSKSSIEAATMTQKKRARKTPPQQPSSRPADTSSQDRRQGRKQQTVDRASIRSGRVTRRNRGDGLWELDHTGTARLVQ